MEYRVLKILPFPLHRSRFFVAKCRLSAPTNPHPGATSRRFGATIPLIVAGRRRMGESRAGFPALFLPISQGVECQDFFPATAPFLPGASRVFHRRLPFSRQSGRRPEHSCRAVSERPLQGSAWPPRTAPPAGQKHISVEIFKVFFVVHNKIFNFAEHSPCVLAGVIWFSEKQFIQ